MIVFFRSADWWPYCKTQLVELQGRLSEIRKAGLGLAARYSLASAAMRRS